MYSICLDRGEEETPFMSSMAQKRLKELRKADPKKVDVTTGLQWIRLELVGQPSDKLPISCFNAIFFE